MENNMIYKVFYVISLLFFFCMFVYSGINKVINFSKKSAVLNKKLSGSKKRTLISDVGLSSVVILEICVSLYIVGYLMYYEFLDDEKKEEREKLHRSMNISVLCMIAVYSAFIILVTFLYHMPSKNRVIPFLSNVTTLAGLMFLGLIVSRNISNVPI